VLLSGKGLVVAEVARQAGVSRPAVWRWQVRLAETGVEGLLGDKTRPPATAKLAMATVAKILALTCSEPPGQGTRWAHWVASALRAFAGSRVVLETGAGFGLDLHGGPGTEARVSMPYPEIFAALSPDV